MENRREALETDLVAQTAEMQSLQSSRDRERECQQSEERFLLEDIIMHAGTIAYELLMCLHEQFMQALPADVDKFGWAKKTENSRSIRSSAQKELDSVH